MKILVIGASHGTGALCVTSALAKGHAVTAFSRTPAKLGG
jgi:putative NADH-flavin reductase